MQKIIKKNHKSISQQLKNGGKLRPYTPNPILKGSIKPYKKYQIAYNTCN